MTQKEIDKLIEQVEHRIDLMRVEAEQFPTRYEDIAQSEKYLDKLHNMLAEDERVVEMKTKLEASEKELLQKQQQVEKQKQFYENELTGIVAARQNSVAKLWELDDEIKQKQFQINDLNSQIDKINTEYVNAQQKSMETEQILKQLEEKSLQLNELQAKSSQQQQELDRITVELNTKQTELTQTKANLVSTQANISSILEEEKKKVNLKAEMSDKAMASIEKRERILQIKKEKLVQYKKELEIFYNREFKDLII